MDRRARLARFKGILNLAVIRAQRSMFFTRSYRAIGSLRAGFRIFEVS